MRLLGGVKDEFYSDLHVYKTCGKVESYELLLEYIVEACLSFFSE